MNTLDQKAVEQIAQRVAELLRDGNPQRVAHLPEPELIDAAEVARRFNVSRDFVYQHADELGARPLGDGRRPRLRFDPQVVLDHLGARPAPASTPPRTPPRRQRSTSAELLPVKGRS